MRDLISLIIALVLSSLFIIAADIRTGDDNDDD